jgi:DNA-binding transcriptional LysR family regulator
MLQAFEAAARLGSIKAAQAELDGSNVSRHCLALEQALGVKLLNRSPRGTLTREGKYLAMILTHTFDELAAALASLEEGSLDPEAIFSIISAAPRCNSGEIQR